MKIKLIILASIAVLASIFLIKYFVSSSQKSKAGENDVTVVVNPVSGTKNLDEFDITYVISSDDQNKKINGVNMTFTANNNLQIISLSQIPKTYPSADDIFTAANEPTINAAKTSLNFAYLTLRPQSELTNSIFFKIRVKGNASGAGTLTLSRVSTEITGILNTTSVLFGISSTSNTDPSFTFNSGSTAPVINFKFDPVTTTVGANIDSAIAVFKIDGLPTGKGLTTFEAIFSFDKNVAEAVNITPSDTVVDKFTEVHKTIDNNIGSIKLTYLAKQVEGMALANNARFDITFKRKSTLTAISTTNTSIDASTATGDITGTNYQINKTNGQLVIHPRTTSSSSSSSRQSSSSSSTVSSSSSSRQSSSSSAARSSSSSSRQSSSSSVSTPSPSNTPLAEVQVALKLRFQGIMVMPQNTTSQRVKVSLVKEGDEQDNSSFYWAEMLPGYDGTYKGTIGVDSIDYNAKYYIYVKGPKHLQKKFCDSFPQSNAQGFYSCGKAKITLHNGQNDFDFSNIKLLAGDLPEQGSVQNEMIDVYDLGIMRQYVPPICDVEGKKQDCTEAEIATYKQPALIVCDINMDNKIDQQDWSLILASMAVKYDEK